MIENESDVIKSSRSANVASGNGNSVGAAVADDLFRESDESFKA